jgi:hypothetical protein
MQRRRLVPTAGNAPGTARFQRAIRCKGERVTAASAEPGFVCETRM